MKPGPSEGREASGGGVVVTCVSGQSALLLPLGGCMCFLVSVYVDR